MYMIWGSKIYVVRHVHALYVMFTVVHVVQLSLQDYVLIQYLFNTLTIMPHITTLYWTQTNTTTNWVHARQFGSRGFTSFIRSVRPPFTHCPAHLTPRPTPLQSFQPMHTRNDITPLKPTQTLLRSQGELLSLPSKQTQGGNVQSLWLYHLNLWLTLTHIVLAYAWTLASMTVGCGDGGGTTTSPWCCVTRGDHGGAAAAGDKWLGEGGTEQNMWWIHLPDKIVGRDHEVVYPPSSPECFSDTWVTIVLQTLLDQTLNVHWLRQHQ